MAKTPKTKISFLCSECGANFPRWQGQCNACKAWNTLAEFKEASLPSQQRTIASQGGYAGTIGNTVKKMSEVSHVELNKIDTQIGELDRVLGNGLTVGSIVLISGDPGAGKTTILTQLSANISKQMVSMYCTAEESLEQFKSRAIERLKIDFVEDNLLLMSEYIVANIMERALEAKVKFLIIDSIQALESEHCNGSAGSVSQVKGCAQELSRFAKQHGITLIIIGHVTKGSDLAGPKTLEHIVDTLLHIEVNDSIIRTIRASKNRFGDVDQVGIFQMHSKGMLSVDNPSKLFLSGADETVAGSAITCIRDGNRNLLLEVQCLVSECEAENQQRVSIGLSFNRLKMITAVLRKHGRIKLFHDVYVNLVGGLKLPETDTSADLAIAASLISSLNDKEMSRKHCFMGEISLSGEVRPINGGVPRVNEAIKHGFEVIYIPKANYHKSMEISGAKIIQIEKIGDLLEALN